MEFRLLCLIDLMEGFRRNEYIAEILGISLEELIKTVKSLQEKDFKRIKKKKFFKKKYKMNT